MVHTEEARVENELQLSWQLNIPFGKVPPWLIESLRERVYDYEDYKTNTSILDNLDNVWNIALVDLATQRVYMFAWGTIDPLEKQMYITRVVKDSELATLSANDTDVEMYDKIKALAKQLKLQRVWFVSSESRYWLKKLPGLVKSNYRARVMEFV